MRQPPTRASKHTQQITLDSEFRVGEQKSKMVLDEFDSIETLESVPRSEVLSVHGIGSGFTAKLGIWNDDGEPVDSFRKGTCPLCGEHHEDYVFARDRFTATVDLSDVDSVCVDVVHPNTKGKYAPASPSRTSLYFHTETVPEDAENIPISEENSGSDPIADYSRGQKLNLLQIGRKGIGDDTATQILDAFGSIEALENATLDEVTEIKGIGEKTASKIGIWDENGEPVERIPRNPCKLCAENYETLRSYEYGLDLAFETTDAGKVCVEGINPPMTGIGEGTVPTVTTLWFHE